MLNFDYEKVIATLSEMVDDIEKDNMRTNQFEKFEEDK